MQKTAFLFAAAALLAAVPATGHAQRYLLTCQSRDGREQLCRADTRGGVRLTRQLSDSPCREGRTWWTTGSGVVVTNGCRAEFELNRGNGNYGYGTGRYGNGGYGNGRYGNDGRYGNGRYGGYDNRGYNAFGNAAGICRRAVAQRLGTYETGVSTWVRNQKRNSVELGWNAGRNADGRCTVDRNGSVHLKVDHNYNRGYRDRDGDRDDRHRYHG